MEPLSLLAGLATVLGIIVAALNIREKLWPKPPKPHPLESALKDIAYAIRAHEIDALLRFAQLKARQCADGAFGDSRVEDASRAFEDIAYRLETLKR